MDEDGLVMSIECFECGHNQVMDIDAGTEEVHFVCLNCGFEETLPVDPEE